MKKISILLATGLIALYAVAANASDMVVNDELASKLDDMMIEPRAEVVLEGLKPSGELEIASYYSEASAEADINVQQKADEIIAEMYADGAETDLEKALWLHDYLAKTIQYDTSLKRHYIDHALLEQHVVCSGYSYTYKYLLNKCGVECENVYSDADWHQWNMVKIDDTWYHVDITYDDPSNFALGYVGHEYFLMSDEAIAEDNNHRDWYLDRGCYITERGRKYDDADWKEVNSPFVFIGDKLYCVKQVKNYDYKYVLVAYDSNLNIVDDNVTGIYTTWKLNNTSSYRYVAWFGGLGEYNGKIVYNTSWEIVELDPETLESSVIYTHGGDDLENDRMLYGSYVYKNKVYFAEGVMDSSGYYRCGTDYREVMDLKLDGSKNDTYKVSLSKLDNSASNSNIYYAAINNSDDVIYGNIIAVVKDENGRVIDTKITYTMLRGYTGAESDTECIRNIPKEAKTIELMFFKHMDKLDSMAYKTTIEI